MRNVSLVLLALLACALVPSSAQGGLRLNRINKGFDSELVLAPSAPADPIASLKSTTDQIIDAALDWDINNLGYLSNFIGPRFSGSKNLEVAIDWIAKLMRSSGFHVTEEPVMIPHWVRKSTKIVFRNPYREKVLDALALGGSISSPAGGIKQAAVVVVRSKEELDSLSPNDVQGNVVVFNQEFVTYGETVAYRAVGCRWAQEKGAVAALIRSVTPFSIYSPHAGNAEPCGIPMVSITKEDAALMQWHQDNKLPFEIDVSVEAETLPDVKSRNLVIDIKGREKPDEIVLIGGHMDSWDVADGALDDGGGIFVSWSTLQLLKKLGLQPRRTVRAVLFVNEENGARGAQQYFLDHQNEVNNTIFAIESDMGTFYPYGLDYTGSDNGKALLQKIGSTLLSSIGAGNVTSPGGGTDIGPLQRAGVPGAAFTVLDPITGEAPKDEIPNGYFYYHHTRADTFDKINKSQINHCLAALAVWTYALAEMDQPFPRT